MKRFSGSFVSRVLLCAVVTLLATMPAWANTCFWARHYSDAELVNGESNYDNARFSHVYLQFNDDDTVATQAHVDAAGTLTLSGGNYTWPAGTVTKTEQNFTLAADDIEVDDKSLSYTTVDDDGNAFVFTGAADTGMNGVPAKWVSTAATELNGNGVIPNFTSTQNQLTVKK